MHAITQLDRSKRARFFSIAIFLSPLAVTAKWFGVVRGFFMYDDFDILLVVREVPLMQSLFVFHGDGPIPLFRVFFTLMYHTFGVNEVFWNIYVILLMLAVNLVALAILIELGVGFVSAALFYVIMLTASAWQLMSYGYYSLTMYPQIGLCGLIAAFALLRWMHNRNAYYKWLTILACAPAPFIHSSGLYVPIAICGIAVLISLAEGKKQKTLGSLVHEFKWLFLSQTIVVATFAAYFAVAFAGYAGPLFGMARENLSFESAVISVYLFLSQGLALELFHSLVGTAMPHAYSYASLLSTIAFCASAIYFAVGLAFLQEDERLNCAALLLPPFIISVMVGVGRRITDINYLIGSSGKYSSVALLWFAMATIYIADCIVRHYLSSFRKQVAVITFIFLCLVVGRHTASTNPWIEQNQLRRQQLYELVAVFAKYAEQSAPAQMHIAELDGGYIYPHYNLLFTYNLAHYRPFFASFDGRLTLLRNEAMFDWGGEAMVTVPSLRNAVDRDFVRALETDHSLQALYFGGIKLQSMPTPQLPTAAQLAVEQLKVSNAQIVTFKDQTLSFSTTGGAEIRLLEGPWDPEAAHVLTLSVAGQKIGVHGTGEDFEIEITFSGELKVPYVANTIRIPTNGQQVSIDLLQLYSYALNPTVRDLTLRFPHGGSYRISGIRLG
jgi:hypothetical protein